MMLIGIFFLKQKPSFPQIWKKMAIDGHLGGWLEVAKSPLDSVVLRMKELSLLFALFYTGKVRVGMR